MTDITARWAGEGGARLQPGETPSVGGDFSPETEICSRSHPGVYIILNTIRGEANAHILPEISHLKVQILKIWALIE